VTESSGSSQTSGSSAPRPLLRTLGCGVLLLVPACAAVLAWLLLRTAPLSDRLVREATALEGAPRPRPSHVSPPNPGTFAQAVAPLLPAIRELPCPEPDSVPRPEDEENEAAWEKWSQASEKLHTQCLAAATGKAPLEQMPPPCRKALDEGRKVMRDVLAATHAETGGLPAGADNLRRNGLDSLAHVMELAALETRTLVAEGHALEAVDTCLDALALSRELSLGGGLEGSKLSASSQELVYRPCAAALDAAPVERKRQALTQLAQLSQGIASPAAVLREESVFHQLTTFGVDFLSREAIARLPPGGKALVGASGGWVYFTSRIGHPLLRRYIWRRNVSLFDHMLAVADLPPDDRKRAFARIDADHTLLAGYPGTVSALQYHRELAHLEPQRLRAAMLTALVQVDLGRAEQGRWPTTLPPEAAEQLALTVISEQQARLTPLDAGAAEHALVLTADSSP
jgi:hypothetical protein